MVDADGQWREIRFHDYDEIYDVPGLYEFLFYEVLKCQSPRVIATMLGEELERDGANAESLCVLDLGAGNGIMAEELHQRGVKKVVGVDIIGEAAQAADRDRPGTYERYVVADMTDLSDADRDVLVKQELNALTCVAALGFGDIPPEAFRTAYNLVADGGWIAFNIRDKFLSGGDTSGFSRMIDAAVDAGALELRARRRYTHRLASSGKPLYYDGLIGTKRHDIPPFV